MFCLEIHPVSMETAGCQGIGLGGKQDVQPDFGMDAGLPVDASPKTLGKVTSHEAAPTPGFFVPLNPFGAHWKEGTGRGPAWFQWGCAGVVVFPMAHLPTAWGTCPHGSCHTGAVAVGMGSSLGMVTG